MSDSVNCSDEMGTTAGGIRELDQYQIGKDANIRSIYYIPNFIDKEEEVSLMRNVARVPKPRWTQLKNRRLQNWGGVPMPKGMLAEEMPSWLKYYTEKIGKLNICQNNIPNHVLVNEYLPGQGIMPHLDGALFYPTISTVNLGSHTILNFYNPIEQTENLNSSTTDIDNNVKEQVLEPVTSTAAADPIKSWCDRLAFSLLLEPRSLVILKDQAYDYYLHGIDETKQDTITSSILNLDNVTDCCTTIGTELQRSTRVSLTIRFVPKSTKNPILKLGK